MVDHNALKEEISAATRYMKLLDIRNTISGQKKNMPLSITMELEGRVTEKLRTFNYPICSVARISVIFTNGLSKELEPEECVYAQARGITLSSYIFSHYVSAKDFEIKAINTMGSRNKGYLTSEQDDKQSDGEYLTPLSVEELNEKVEFLMKRVENLERIEMVFAENIPKMARDMNDLKEKIDRIYRTLYED